MSNMAIKPGQIDREKGQAALKRNTSETTFSTSETAQFVFVFFYLALGMA